LRSFAAKINKPKPTPPHPAPTDLAAKEHKDRKKIFSVFLAFFRGKKINKREQGRRRLGQI